MMKRGKDWLNQAQNDLLFARSGLESGFYSQVCFLSQQAAEKAAEALAFQRGASQVKSHSILKIFQELKINGELEEAAKHLDTFYISARYPDALPGGAPFEFFTKNQALAALTDAELITTVVAKEVLDEPGD